MNESQISVRYAKALFQIAEEKKILDKVNQDMQLLSMACGLEEFQFLLALPSLQASQKRTIIEAVLKDRISESSMSMIALVIRNKRESYLPAKARGISSVSFITATEVGNEVIEQVKKMVADAYKSEVVLASTVNANLIGGFILTVEGQRYDASVSGSLRKMEKQLLKTSTENS